jgi:hypothetical protein
MRDVDAARPRQNVRRGACAAGAAGATTGCGCGAAAGTACAWSVAAVGVCGMRMRSVVAAGAAERAPCVDAYTTNIISSRDYTSNRHNVLTFYSSKYSETRTCIHRKMTRGI